MTAPEWWTTADQAELDLRIHSLVDHVKDCQHPFGGTSVTCAGCREAIDGLIKWRERRMLQSRAEYERAFADMVLGAAEAA